MELVGEVAIPAPRDRVWNSLNDPAVLRSCIPGCEELVDESPTVRKARVMVKVGPVRARFSGRMTLTEVDAPQRCVLGFEGSGGAAGMASGQSRVELHEAGGDTRVSYAVKASVGGKLGQIGGRMIDASAKQLADQFFAALREQVAPSAAAPATPTTAPVEAPQQPTAPVVAADTPTASDVNRVLWFLLGAATTAFGAWLGKVLF